MPPFKYKEYSIWDDVSLILMMASILIFYTGSAYYFMKFLKFTINAIKEYFKKEKC